MKILFVCLGNICRSPTAEAVLRALAKESDLELFVDSAGTAAFHVGSQPDHRSQSAAKARGVSMAGQRARQVCTADFHEFDYVFAMDRQNLNDLIAIQPVNGKAKLALFLETFGSKEETEVPDPYYGGPSGFEHVLDLLENASRNFLKELAN